MTVEKQWRNETAERLRHKNTNEFDLEDVDKYAWVRDATGAMLNLHHIDYSTQIKTKISNFVVLIAKNILKTCNGMVL